MATLFIGLLGDDRGGWGKKLTGIHITGNLFHLIMKIVLCLGNICWVFMWDTDIIMFLPIQRVLVSYLFSYFLVINFQIMYLPSTWLPSQIIGHSQWKWKCWSLSHVQFFATPWSVAPPGSSVHGILQARILEWVGIPFYRGSSQPRDQTRISCTVSRFFTIRATREVPGVSIKSLLSLSSEPLPSNHSNGLPWWLRSEDSTCQYRRHRFNPWVRKIPWRRKWQPSILAWKIPWTEKPVGYSPWDPKELDTTVAPKQ